MTDYDNTKKLSGIPPWLVGVATAHFL